MRSLLVLRTRRVLIFLRLAPMLDDAMWRRVSSPRGFMNYTALTHEAISHLSGPKTREVDSVDTAGGALAQQGSGLAEVVNYKSYDGQLGHSVRSRGRVHSR